MKEKEKKVSKEINKNISVHVEVHRTRKIRPFSRLLRVNGIIEKDITKIERLACVDFSKPAKSKEFKVKEVASVTDVRVLDCGRVEGSRVIQDGEIVDASLDYSKLEN